MMKSNMAATKAIVVSEIFIEGKMASICNLKIQDKAVDIKTNKVNFSPVVIGPSSFNSLFIISLAPPKFPKLLGKSTFTVRK